MRQNGHGTSTLEDARTWIEETGLCLFLPRRQFSSSITPSFVEAVAGHRNPAPDPQHIALAEELLVRLEHDDIAVRLNLLGQPSEQPDFIVASWVLPFVYALRGDRDWRRSPQLTGSRQVSPLAIQTYKQLETGEATVAELRHALGREVTDGAVLRAITELWQQLRIIPLVSGPGQPVRWQLLRQRFQKAIAEGASTSQVTAISVLASIYLQAVIAASMEEVEIFLSPLTARSKIREVLRGLVATRQVHTISMGHAPQFYVAGTLPEFASPPTIYASSAMPASAYFLHSYEHEHEHHEHVHREHAHQEPVHHEQAPEAVAQQPVTAAAPVPAASRKSEEPHAPRTPSARKPAAGAKAPGTRPHFARPSAHARDRKPAQASSGNRPARRSGAEVRGSGARPATAHGAAASRPASGGRWNQNPSKNTNGKHSGTHSASASGSGTRSNGNSARSAKPAPSAWSQRNGRANTKSAGKSGAAGRGGSLSRGGSAPRKDARPAHAARKPALAASAKAGNTKRYGFTAPRKSAAAGKQGTKKRG